MSRLPFPRPGGAEPPSITPQLRPFIEGVRRAELAAAISNAAAGDAPVINRTGAFSIVALDLSSSSFNPVNVTGYAFVVLPDSTPGTLLDIDCGGSWSAMAPGQWFTGHFDSVQIRRSSNSVTSGTARILIVRDPRVGVGQFPDTSASGGLGGGAVGPAGAGTQTAASAAGNIPTAATDGVSLEGVSGVRVILSAAAAQTLSGAGTVRLWLYDSTLARWVRGRIDYSVDIGTVRDIVFPDEVVRVPRGRIYAEAISVTVSGGALTVTIQTWG